MASTLEIESGAPSSGDAASGVLLPGRGEIPGGPPNGDRTPARGHTQPPTPNITEWLNWLVQVRFLMITVLLGIVVVLQQYTHLAVPTRPFAQLVVLWYTLAIFYAIVLRWVPIA